MITVRLPNGTEVDVNTEDSQQAAAAARLYFQREFPEDFAAHARTQPSGGFLARTARGIDEFQGRLYSGVETVGALVGSEGLQRFGREGELRNRLEAEQALPAAQLRSFEGAEGVGGALSAGQQAVAGSLPELPGPFAGAAAGYRIGGIRGAIVGAALGSLPSFVGSNAQRQREAEAQRTGQEPERIPAPGTAIVAGTVQAGVSGALDVLTLRLARVLGIRPGEVGANLFPRILRGIGAGAVTEMPAEVIESVIERAQAGLPILDEDAFREYREAAIGGVVAGGTLGGTVAGVLGPRPSRTNLTEEQIQSAIDGGQPAVTGEQGQPTPATPEPLVGERPQPFAAPDQAADYLAENPAPAGLRTPEAATTWANARRQAEWEAQVEAARPVALAEFTAPPTTPEAASQSNQTFFGNIAEAAVTDQIRLTGFKPVDVARYAFESRGLQNVKPSKPEIEAVTQRLDSLVAGNLLERTGDGVYRVSTRPATQAPVQPAPEVQATRPTPQVRPEIPPTPAERTETPETQQAQQNLAEIAQTGNLATPASPLVQNVSDAWRAYSTATGTQINSPLVEAARVVASSRGRSLTLKEFQTLYAGWNSMPTPDARAAFVQHAALNRGYLSGRGPVFQIPQAPPLQATQVPPEQETPTTIPITPSPTAQPAEQITQTEQVPERPVTGFTTAQGSTYEVNELGQTIRTKRSPGRGQGQTYAPHNVLFVRPEEAATILDDMRRGGTYRFVVDDADGPRFIEAGESLQGRRAALAVFNPDGTFNRYVPSQTTPAIGLAPVELRYEGTGPDRRSNRHVGNTITELNGRRPEPVVPQEAVAPETETETEAAATEAEVIPPPTPEVDPDPNQPPPEAIAQDTSQAATTDIRNTPNGIYAGMVGMLPDDPVVGKQTIERAMRDSFFNRVLRAVASPLLTMPKVRPELADVAGVSRFEAMRAAKSNSEIQNLFARNFDKVPEQEIPAMTRALIQSSTDRKPAVTTGLSEAAAAKIRDTQQAFQRLFDFFIESNVIRYFDPREATNLADAARLNAMWEKHRGKGLFEIPAADLKRASKTGYDQMQKLNALRNPYYFPMTSGSKQFFIGAYPKGADGKRKPGAKPVKIIPIDAAPSGLLSSGAPDPVQAARDELARLGITDRTHYITPQPIEFTRDKVASEARDSADVLAPFFKMLQATVGNNAEARRIVNDMQNALSRASMQSILRPNQGILHPITGINETTYFTSTVPNYAAGINKLQARRYTEHSFERAIRDLPRADQEYWRTYRDYNSAPNEAAWISTVRTINFHKYMGGALDSMFANGFQVYSGTMPILMRDSGGTQGARILQDTVNQVLAKFKTTGRAAASKDFDTYLKDVIKQLARNPAEAKALADAARLDVFTPIHTTQLGGVTEINIEEGLRRRGVKNAKKIQDAFETVLNLSGLPQRTIETMNRLTTFLAAYRVAQANPNAVKTANFFDNTNFKGPSANFYYAVSRVDDTQYLMGREDRAYFTRAFKGAELVFQFMTYAFKTSEIYLTNAYNVVRAIKAKDPQLAKAAAIGFLAQTGSIIALAGVWGLPFALVLRELGEAIVNLVWKEPRDFDDELREASGDGTFAKILTRGVLHTSGILAASQRMGVNPIPFEEISSWNPLQIFGPIGGSLIDDIINTYQYLNKGDYWNAAASLPITPRVIGNAFRGANLEFGTEEYRTPRGQTTVSREQIDQLDQRSLVPTSIRQALGFGSPGVADLRDAYRIIREVERQNQGYAQSIISNLARAEADRIRAVQDQNPEGVSRAIAERTRLLQEHAARNEAYRRAGETDRMYNPNMDVVRRRALEMVYGTTSPEMLNRRGGPGTRAEIQEIVRRYSPQ